MTPFDPILHDHEKRLKILEDARRRMEEEMIVMDAMDRRRAAKMKEFEDFIADEIQYQLERAREQKEYEQRMKAQLERHNAWLESHDLIMREFDEKLNAVIAIWDDLIKRFPKNGK